MRQHIYTAAGLRSGCENPHERRYKSAGGTSTSSTSEPWAGSKPYLTRGYEAASRGILDMPKQFFPGSTVVPFSPETEASMGATNQRALSGSPVLGAAQGYTSDVLSGKAFAPGSPLGYSIASAVRPGVDSSFARAGRGGSPLHTEALSRGMASAMAPYMESAANRAPGLAREDYYDIDRLGQVGAAREGKAGEELGDQIARWDFAQNEPGNRAQQYNSVIGGIPTAFNQTSQSRNNVNSGMFWGGTALQAAPAFLGGK